MMKTYYDLKLNFNKKLINSQIKERLKNEQKSGVVNWK